MQTASVCERIDRILEKLKRVRESGISSFGDDQHDFHLNPPLLESDIVAFESRHNILLPEDYREFLLRAGNGGAGPYCGILPLEQWHAVALWVVFDEEADIPDDFPSQPCPLHPGMSREKSWEKDLIKSDLGFPWDSYYQGALALADQGCTFYSLLIVSGSARGRVVYVDLQGNNAPYFVENTNFLSWYERWLDELLAGFNIAWFGFGMPGMEPDLREVLLSNPSGERREAAAQSMLRLSALSEASVIAIITALKDEDPKVRAAAAKVWAKFKSSSENGSI